jgi:hypothetical protein
VPPIKRLKCSSVDLAYDAYNRGPGRLCAFYPGEQLNKHNSPFLAQFGETMTHVLP